MMKEHNFCIGHDLTVIFTSHFGYLSGSLPMCSLPVQDGGAVRLRSPSCAGGVHKWCNGGVPCQTHGICVPDV